jgi:hypothetical protein
LDFRAGLPCKSELKRSRRKTQPVAGFFDLEDRKCSTF